MDDPLTYRQMANEIKAVGMEKADALAKGERLKRMPEMLAITRYKIEALRQIWSLLDRMAKADEGGEKPSQLAQEKVSSPPAPADLPPLDDDDF